MTTNLVMPLYIPITAFTDRDNVTHYILTSSLSLFIGDQGTWLTPLMIMGVLNGYKFTTSSPHLSKQLDVFLKGSFITYNTVGNEQVFLMDETSIGNFINFYNLLSKKLNKRLSCVPYFGFCNSISNPLIYPINVNIQDGSTLTISDIFIQFFTITFSSDPFMQFYILFVFFMYSNISKLTDLATTVEPYMMNLHKQVFLYNFKFN